MSDGIEVELPRADLASTLLEASHNVAKFLCHDTIVEVHQDPRGVSVELAHAEPRRFDKVIGADGLHSKVRGLVFGSERDFVHHMGMYVPRAASRAAGPRR